MGLVEEIDMEAEDREAADAALQEQIDSIETGEVAVEVPIFFTSGPDLAHPGPFWRMGVGHLSLVTTYGIVMPMSGKIKDLIGYSLFKPDPDDNESISFEVLKNNANTGLKCEITGFSNCRDWKDSVIVEAGDTLAVLVFASLGIKPSEVGASVVLEKIDPIEGSEVIGKLPYSYPEDLQ